MDQTILPATEPATEPAVEPDAAEVARVIDAICVVSAADAPTFWAAYRSVFGGPRKREEPS